MPLSPTYESGEAVVSLSPISERVKQLSPLSHISESGEVVLSLTPPTSEIDVSNCLPFPLDMPPMIVMYNYYL